MAFSVQVSQTAKRACIRAEGHVDMHATIAAGYRVAGDSRLGEHYPVLIDLRGASWMPNHDEAMDIANAIAQIPRHAGRIALLVGTTALAGARTFCLLAGIYGLHVEPFDRTTEAHRWLSVGPRPA